MELINGTLFMNNSVSEEEAQNFLNEQERWLERPIIIERVNGEKETHYVTGRILDDILGNLEHWSEFDDFEDALEETEKFKDGLKEKEKVLRQVRDGIL
jgi:hypothetical protein